MKEPSFLKQKTSYPYPPFAVYAVIIFFWASALFYVIALKQDKTPQHFVAQFLNGFYIPHHNLCPIGGIGRFNIDLYIYLLIAFSFATILVFKQISRRSYNRSFFPELQRITIIVFTAMLLLQTMNQIRHFVVTFHIYNGKVVEERRFGVLKETHDFAQYCKKLLPGAHNAALITDLDTSRDPGMFTHRALAFYLYPIDIRGIRESEKNVLIAFEKKDALKNIPKDYQLIGSTNENNAAAIKQAGLP